MGKSLSDKYGQKLLDSAKKSTTDAIKTDSKRAIQQTAGGTGDLIGNKTTYKITSNSKKKSNKYLQKNETEEDFERSTHEKKYIYPEEKQQITDALSLVPRKDV